MEIENNNKFESDDVANEKIRVYVKRNEAGNIININSELFIDDLNEWEYYDEGYGDKYAHAQSQYFDKPIIDEEGNYNY